MAEPDQSQDKQSSSEQSTRSAASKRGQWVTIGIVMLGLLAGVIAASYWQGVSRRTVAKQAAGGHQSDPLKVASELEILEHKFTDVARGTPGQIRPVLDGVLLFVERHPNDAGGHRLCGLVYAALVDHENAIKHFSKSLALDGQQAEVHQFIGDLLIGEARLDEAAKHFDLAISLAPTVARYRSHLAHVYLAQGRYDEAKSLFVQALMMDSTMHEANAALADLYARQGKNVLALTQISKAIANMPLAESRELKVIYLRRKGALLRRDGQAGEAILLLTNLREREQMHIEVMEEIAVTWTMLSKPDRAAKVFTDACDAQPMDWRYAEGAARWLIKADKREEAQRYVRRLKELNPAHEALAELERSANAQ